jgi:two-component system alkaline phosphatase synthesis response regulator PhoP
MDKIYIAEDDDSISRLYECALDSNGLEAVCFETAEKLFEALKSEIPSAIIMDLMLPGMDGITAIGLLKKNPLYSGIPVIIISANGEETMKVKGLDRGAEDYIEKPFGMLEFIARVKKVLSRKNSQSGIITLNGLEMNVKKHTVTAEGKNIELTPKEFDILYLLLSRRGEVLKREEIFNLIWGENYFTETRTLDIHINSIRQKLSAACGKEYINTVRGVGYIIE